MVCEECKQHPATVHITRIVNNHKMQVNLCEDCARLYQHQWGFNVFEPSFSINKFLAGLMQQEQGMARPYRLPNQCDQCGFTYEQFGQLGKLGCDRCYRHFASNLEPLLKRIHGTSYHSGKIPRRAGGNLRVKQEIEKLKADLQVLIVNEEFEKAALVRDRVRELEKNLQG